MNSDNRTEKRVIFDFAVDFSNSGGIQGQGFRLDIAGDDITDQELADYIVRDMRLLMVSAVRILNKEIIVETHKRAESTETTLSQLLKMTAERAISYREGIDERPVSPPPESIARLAELGGPIPEQPADAETVITMLDEIGSPTTVTTAGGRYFGFVNGSSLPAALAASWLVAAWDQNAALSVESPVGAALEEIALGWLLDLLGLPAGCGGAFVTGATMANFTCLAAARNFVLKNAGWDVEARGLFGAPTISMVVGEEAHPTLMY
jgi:Pyridoxal-dependent decarboxylase conserved domain